MALTREAALALIYQAIRSLNCERDSESQITTSLDTPLFGATADMDSLALVSLIADVETSVSDAVGEPVCLTDDQALAQEISPFTSVDTLLNYILSLTGPESKNS